MKPFRMFKKTACFLAAAALIAAPALPAFAEDLPTNANTGTAENPVIHNVNTASAEATSFITKNFIMDRNVTTPAETFTFTIEGTTLTDINNTDTGKNNGATVPEEKEPEIKVKQDGNATLNQIAIADGTAGTFVDANSREESATGTVRLVQKTAAFTDQDGNPLTGADFPYAGEYVYTVKETAGTNTAGTDTAVKYSSAEYQVHFFVANKTANTTNYNGDDGALDANGGAGLYIAAISAARMTTTDDYNATKTDFTPVKVNTTLGSGYNKAANALDFQNMYVEYSKLKLAKKVSGPYADQTKYFTFSTKIDVPAAGVVKNAAGDPLTASYTAYVYDASVTPNTRVAAADNNGHPVEYTFVSGTAQDVLLKHNQYLLFETSDGEKNLPVGTTYTSTEAAAPDYTATAKVTYSTKDAERNDVNTDKTEALGNAAKAANKDLTVIEYTEAGFQANPKTVDKTLVGEGTGNAAEFLNTYKSVTPTGIVLDNLPYILLVLLGAAGMFLLVLAGKKRRKHTD